MTLSLVGVFWVKGMASYKDAEVCISLKIPETEKPVWLDIMTD
jgi:hypothetical protein